MDAVKRERSSSTRSAKVLETRTRVLDAALQLFLTHGYNATSIEAIAEKAGVSVPTVYVRFETKRALLKDLVDRDIAGDDEPVPMLERPWMRAALAAPTGAELLERVVTEARRVHERTVPLIMVIRSAAAGDVDIQELWRTLQEQRHTVAAAIVDTLKRRGFLRAGISVRQATDVVYAELSPDMFAMLVHQRGWTPRAWERFATALLVEQLTSDS
jgi:AcrR family transcriptional regulator